MSIYDKLLNLLQEIFDADSDRKMFHFPVDTTKIAGYKQAIKNPTDLSKIKLSIETKQKNQEPIKASDVYNELNLMISNALVFNQGKKNPFRKHAKKISKVIAKAWRKRQSEENGGKCNAENALDVPEDEIEFMPDEAADDDEDEDYLMELEQEEGDVDDDDGKNKNMKNHEKKGENIAETVKALKEEAEVPLEQLRAQYEAFLAKQKNNNNNENSDDDGDEDDEEEFDDSNDDDWDEEEEDDDENEDEENFEDSSSGNSDEESK